MKKNNIIKKTLNQARKNWEKDFKQLAENADDKLLFDDIFQDEDFEEWD